MAIFHVYCDGQLIGRIARDNLTEQLKVAYEIMPKLAALYKKEITLCDWADDCLAYTRQAEDGSFYVCLSMLGEAVFNGNSTWRVAKRNSVYPIDSRYEEQPKPIARLIYFINSEGCEEVGLKAHDEIVLPKIGKFNNEAEALEMLR